MIPDFQLCQFISYDALLVKYYFKYFPKWKQGEGKSEVIVEVGCCGYMQQTMAVKCFKFGDGFLVWWWMRFFLTDDGAVWLMFWYLFP